MASELNHLFLTTTYHRSSNVLKRNLKLSLIFCCITCYFQNFHSHSHTPRPHKNNTSMCGPQQPTDSRLIILDLEANRQPPGPHPHLLCVARRNEWLTRAMAFPTLSQETATTRSPEGDRTGKETEARSEQLPCAGAPDPSPGRDGAGQTDRHSKPRSAGGGLEPPPWQWGGGGSQRGGSQQPQGNDRSTASPQGPVGAPPALKRGNLTKRRTAGSLSPLTSVVFFMQGSWPLWRLHTDHHEEKCGSWNVPSHSVRPDSATFWAVACQVSLFLRFFKQEYWSGLPSPSPGDFPHPRIKPASSVFWALQCILHLLSHRLPE